MLKRTFLLAVVGVFALVGTVCSTALGQYTVQHYYPGLEDQLAIRNAEIRKANKEQARRFQRYMAFQQEQARRRAVEADRQHAAKYGGYVGGVYINPNYRGK